MAKRALLIGVPGSGLNVRLALDRLTPVLERLGFRVASVHGRRATRAGILEALDRLIGQAEAGDACLVYYFGHGGRVAFDDLDGPPAAREFGYVTCTQEVRGVFEAVLDVELSRRMTALEARSGNVTAMLDCCYSAELVRSRDKKEDVALGTRRVADTPAWAREAIAARAELSLAVDSHPGIVRLCGASPQRTAFAVERGGRHIGRLTEAFIETVDAAGDRWTQLSWDSIVHHLRERVVVGIGNEGQWVALAGPRERRLFSREASALPGVVAASSGEQPSVASLRAGWHQGVSVGDRWAIASLELDDDGGPRVVARGVVSAVERNRSTLTLDTEQELALGSPAFVEGVAVPMGVAGLDGDSTIALARAIEGSAWLRIASADEAAARVELDGERARIIDVGGGRLTVERVAADVRGLVALLEDWARADTLARSFAANEAQRTAEIPVRFGWARAGEGDAREPLPEQGASLSAGERVIIELENTALFDPWFVSVVMIDPAGRLRLLNTRMPEGIELSAQQRESIGYRVGLERQGLELRWPAGVDASAGPASLWVLSARRPICLAHIVRSQAVDEDDALALQGLAGDTMRSHAPELTKGCGWQRVEFSLGRQG